MVTATKTLILVDWSNILYTAWYASQEYPWLAYVRFFELLKECVQHCRTPGTPIEFIFAGESRTPLIRSELYPQYKANRQPPANPDFRQYRRNLSGILEEILGWKIISCPGSEADDVIASIVAQQCHRCQCLKKCDDCTCADKYTTDVVIFSNDRDLLQLLSWERVRVYQPPGRIMTKAVFYKSFGYSVDKYEMWKALTGDESDNIPGIEGFDTNSAKKAILAHSVISDIWMTGGMEAIAQYERNLQLIRLNTRCIIDDTRVLEPPSLEKLNDLDGRIALAIRQLEEVCQ